MAYDINKLKARKQRVNKPKQETEMKDTDILSMQNTPFEDRELQLHKSNTEDGKANLFEFTPSQIVGEDIKGLADKVEDHYYTDEKMVETTLETINKMVDAMYDRDPDQIDMVNNVASMRAIDPEVLLENHCFYVPNTFRLETKFADMRLYANDLHITSSSNTLWKERFVIPIRDFHGKVYGFVGYDKFSNAKYVEYSSPVYKKAIIKALGLNHTQEILDSKYCIFTEGSFDFFRGRQHEFSIIANLGVSFNKLLKLLIDRLDVVFTAYDNDDTGIKNKGVIDRLHSNVYHINFRDIEKEVMNDETGELEPKVVKGDLDEALKDLDNVEALKREIKIRVDNPMMKMGHIWI